MSRLDGFITIEKKGIEPRLFPNQYFYYYSLPDYDHSGNPSIVQGKEVDSNKFEISSGLILISKLNPRIRRVWKVFNDEKYKSISSTEFIPVYPNKETDINYLYYFLQTDNVYSQLESFAIGSTNSHTRFKPEFLGSLKSNFPPLPQQHKIAHILSTCDKVIEKTEQAIAKYEDIKKGMMHDLFTRGIDMKTGKLRPKYEDAPELYKESELGMIPRDWEVKKLEEYLYLKSGEGITSESIDNSGDYPVYGGNGLRGYTKTFTHEGLHVLIGRQGALCGNIVLATGKFYASEHAVVVTILDNCDTRWVEYKLHSMELNQYSEASAQPGLSVNKIYKLPTANPLSNEQMAISQRILSLEKKISSEQNSLNKHQILKSGLMQDLLSGKVDVQVSEPEFK